jgi:hypothetical protein
MVLKSGEYFYRYIRSSALNTDSGQAEIVYDETQGCAEM